MRDRASLLAEAQQLIRDGGPDTLLRSAHAAALLGISPLTLGDIRRRGRGPRFVLSGGRPAYLARDLEAYLDSRAVATADQPAASANKGGAGL
jgi:hypothetical protein